MDASSTFLAELSYAIPLLIAIVLILLVAYWSRARSAALPSMNASRPPGYSVASVDKTAYLSLEEGRFLPTIDLLGRRLARSVEGRYHVRLEEARSLASVELELPSSLTLAGVLDDLLKAYRAAEAAETASWLNGHWPWLLRRRRARASTRFATVLREVSTALGTLEAA